MRRGVIVGWLLLLLACGPSSPPTVTPGVSVLGFEHDPTATTGYELCWADTCTAVIVTNGAPDAQYCVTLPDRVPEGPQTLTLVALGPGGRTASAPLRVTVEAVP